MTDLGEQIFTVAQWALLGGLLLLFLPFRHTTRIKASRVLRASAETVWATAITTRDFTAATKPDNPLLADTVVGSRKLSDDPLTYEITLDLSRGQGAHLMTMRTRILANEPPRHYVSTIEDLNGAPSPLGQDNRIEITLEDVPGGVRYTQSHVFRTRTLYHDLATRFAYARQINKVAAYFNGGIVDSQAGDRRGLIIRIGLSLLTVASFALAFGWQFGIGLALIFLLHEFGHWLAMRLAGYPKARLTLVPFLGGVASPGQPYRSQWDAAICVLMGPGLSALLCGIALLFAHLPDLAPGPNRIDLVAGASPFEDLADLFRKSIVGVGVLNLFQLIPVMPLDGGQLVRLLIQRKGSDVARIVSMGVGGLACLGAIGLHQYLLAPIALIGVALLGQQSVATPQGAEMSTGQRLAVLAGSLACLLLLTVASAPILADFVGYNSPSEAIAFLGGFKRPLPGADGSEEVAPTFEVVAPMLAGRDVSTYVRGGDGRNLRVERRQWGSVLDADADVLIRLVDTSGTAGIVKDIAELRQDFEASLHAEDVETQFENSSLRIDTRHGPFDALGFTAKGPGLGKSCIGFASYLDEGRHYLYGHYCAATGATASVQDVACLLDGLTIAGEAVSATTSRPGCAPTVAPAQ